jgi:hypothetical protein
MRYLDVDTPTRISKIGPGTWQFGSKEWGYGDGYAGSVARDIVRRRASIMRPARPGATFLRPVARHPRLVALVGCQA